MDYLFLFLGGIGGGLLAGMLGIGGGVVYVLVLPLALTHMGVPADELVQFTIANSLFATCVASISSNVMLIRHKNFFLNPVLWIGIPGAVSAQLSLEYIVHTPWYSQKEFNLVVSGLLIIMLLRMLFYKNKAQRPENLQRGGLFGTGVATGVASSVSGLGGGIVVVPVLNSVMHADIKKATSISIGVIGLTSFAVSVRHFFMEPAVKLGSLQVGYILLPAALLLSLGVIIGSPAGVSLAKKVPAHIIRTGFAVFLLLIIMFKLYSVYF
ncbi:MAG: sulfite exporter TauE/SafE family protein [Chitinophagaceae bacterium]|nr:MAG: sulfite exporter TauE/SafE family protein [Chitinophagaceae bacterium]